VLLFSTAFLCYNGILHKIVLKIIFLKCNFSLCFIANVYCVLFTHVHIAFVCYVFSYYERMCKLTMKFGINYVPKMKLLSLFVPCTYVSFCCTFLLFVL
jgi:hypothetical protein